ncbi:hypothetical protein CGMCC3_g1419 [Colletotrichum fructicola]|nr:uncharacterized protein CGMCC3_g1419 [Colletotrichum fructicola]KAE9582136.1 hypothetical protein CGMCC3_g1419 [Colletotrichum fructicola]KAI8281984.1 hypothetical protein K4K60_003875 [Colletotrichum sp. SAR11_57]
MDTRDGIKVVIPPEFLDGLKSHPHLSFKASIDNDMQKEYTNFGGPPEFLIHAIKSGITASLQWKRTTVHDQMLQIVGCNNARVFLSTEASQNDDWIRYSTGYVLSTFDCIRKIKQWHPMLRPMVYWFLPERKEIKLQWACAKKHVKKAMEARQHKGDSLENPPSMLDLLSSGKNSHLATRMDDQVLYQMTLIAVGTVTTHASIVQAVYDLATYPEYIPILREEIQSVSRDHDGLFTKDAVMALKKLDSFMKESQRLSAGDLSNDFLWHHVMNVVADPLFLGTFQRAATAHLTLPDGTFIPKGTKIEVNTASIHVDEAYYPDPQRFDGLRYYRLRQRPGDENKHMYYSVGKNDLSFGFGRHACPGRYLGHLNIKLVMAELLMEYDVQTTLKSGRPKNIEFEALVAPDPDFEILLKSRRHS